MSKTSNESKPDLIILGRIASGLPQGESDLGHRERHAKVLITLLEDHSRLVCGPVSIEDFTNASFRIWAAPTVGHLRLLANELLHPLGFSLAMIDEHYGTQFSLDS